jgi:hypothetical protein
MHMMQAIFKIVQINVLWIQIMANQQTSVKKSIVIFFHNAFR